MASKKKKYRDMNKQVAKLTTFRCHRIPYDVMIHDVEEAIEAQVSPRLEQMTLADFDYNVYHPFEEVRLIEHFLRSAHTLTELLEVGLY